MLDQAADVLQLYKKLCIRSFGPNALNNLFVTATGQVALTNNGAEIMKCLNVQHPVAKLIKDTLVGFHAKYGDGTKTLLFLIAETIAQIQRLLAKNKEAQPTEKLRIVRTLQHLQYTFFENDVAKSMMLMEYKLCSERMSDRTLSLLKTLIITKLNGTLRTNSCTHFADLLVNIIERNCANEEDLVNCLEGLYDHSELVFVEQVGGNLWQSYVIDGVILQRSFHELSSTGSYLRDVSFVLTGLCLETDECDQNARIKLTRQTPMTDILFWKSRLYSVLTEHWKSLGVNLVISASRVPDQLILSLAKSNISVIHFCPESDMERLSALSNCQIESDLPELLFSQCTGHAEICEVITIAARNCVHFSGVLKKPDLACVSLNGSGSGQETSGKFRANEHISGHVVIHSPSAGVCQQTKILLSHTCKLLAVTLKAEKQSSICVADKLYKNSIVDGGGAFEITVHHFLSQLAGKHVDGLSSSVMKILAQSYLSIPLLLVQNSNRPSAKNSSVKDMLCIIKTLKCMPCIPQGIDARNGSRLLPKGSTLEPVALKIGQWHHLVMTVSQLLRLDTIVSVRGSLIQTNQTDSDDDSIGE